MVYSISLKCVSYNHILVQAKMSSTCQECGNNHFGPCATEETCFVWNPEGRDVPSEVLITGSWTKWQTVERLSREANENGEVYFRISLTLLAGNYEYKYIVDGDWRYDPKLPVVDDQHGSCNNQIRVLRQPLRSSPRRNSCPSRRTAASRSVPACSSRACGS
jgi:hypothetical protein